jgi:death-on-curing protein
MSGIEYLELEDVGESVRILGGGPIRDAGMLDCAVHRPRSNTFGEDPYGTVGLKVAALLHSMTENRTLVDGNQRLAWLSTVVFCDLNGVTPRLVDDEASQLEGDIAGSDLGIDQIAARLRLDEGVRRPDNLEGTRRST